MSETLLETSVPHSENIKEKLVNHFIGPYNDPTIIQETTGMRKRQTLRYMLISSFKKFIAEYFGTFSLVFCVSGIGATPGSCDSLADTNIILHLIAYAKSLLGVSAQLNSNFATENITVGLTHGLILCGLIYAFGATSGARTFLYSLNTNIFECILIRLESWCHFSINTLWNISLDETSLVLGCAICWCIHCKCNHACIGGKGRKSRCKHSSC